jgi:hypothetical protein
LGGRSERALGGSGRDGAAGAVPLAVAQQLPDLLRRGEEPAQDVRGDGTAESSPTATGDIRPTSSRRPRI